LGRALNLEELAQVAEGIREALQSEHESLLSAIGEQMEHLECEADHQANAIGRLKGGEPSTAQLQQFVHKLQEVASSSTLPTTTNVVVVKTMTSSTTMENEREGRRRRWWVRRVGGGEGGGETGGEDGVFGFRQTVAGGDDVGTRRNVRERRVHSEKTHAPSGDTG